MTYLQLRQQKVSYWLVPELFRYKSKDIVVHPSFIEDLVIKKLDISHDELVGRIRTLPISRARHLLCYLMNKYTNLHLAQIGKLIGGRHHSTVIHGIQAIKNVMTTEPGFKELVERIEQKII